MIELITFLAPSHGSNQSVIYDKYFIPLAKTILATPITFIL
jgi:hypothetical protein